MWARWFVASSFFTGLALRIYYDSLNVNIAVVLFGMIYAYSTPTMPSNAWVFVNCVVAKCAGYAPSPYLAVAMFALMRGRIQRKLRSADDFTVFSRTLIQRVGCHPIYGLAAYTTRAELTWWVVAHLALGLWGLPAMLLMATPDPVDADYTAYVTRRRHALNRCRVR